MPSITNEAIALLSQLYAHKSSWACLTAFKPISVDADTDTNIRQRHLALLAVHASPPGDDHSTLVDYLLDQETLYHQKADHYRSALSLAAYLTATRVRTPQSLWGIWVARETNYDASKCVDPHYMYYAAGSLDNAESYVRGCTDVAEVVGNGAGRMVWWTGVLEDHGSNEAKALEALKEDVCARIEHDRKYGVTDETVRAFVEASWRRETREWSQSLLLDETWGS